VEQDLSSLLARAVLLRRENRAHPFLPLLVTTPLVPSSQPAPIHLNHNQLARYTGADPNKPIYLAIDSVLFDVSANRRVYGPGGSYNMMFVDFPSLLFAFLLVN